MDRDRYQHDCTAWVAGNRHRFDGAMRLDGEQLEIDEAAELQAQQRGREHDTSEP